MNQLVIYKTGDTQIHTTVTNGYCDFTGYGRENGENYTVVEYLEKKGPGFVCIPFDDALKQIDAACDAQYIGAWEKIPEKKWDYALNVLPPEKWMTVKGINIFRMCEKLTGNITAHYARAKLTDGRELFFTANRRTSDSYDTLAMEIAGLL
jgi:hypothetical protein